MPNLSTNFKHLAHVDATLTRNILDQIVSAGASYDWIVGVARGGLVPAVYISHAIGSPLIPLRASFRDHTAFDVLDIDLTDKTVLVVDDIADSGATLTAVVDMLRSCGAATIHTAVLYHKPVTSTFIPTYYGYESADPNHWIDFSWEVFASSDP